MYSTVFHWMRLTPKYSRNTKWILSFFQPSFFIFFWLKSQKNLLNNTKWNVRHRFTFFSIYYIIIINAVDEMHEINDWFGRSQNGIAESERRCIYTTEEERLMKKFQSCFNGCHKWMEKKSIYYFIKLQQQMKTLTTCIRCAIFDLISSINTTIYLQYRTVGHSGMNSKYW